MKKIGYKLLMLAYGIFCIVALTVVFLSARRTGEWDAFIQTFLYLCAFSVPFLGGLLFCGRREIVSYSRENGGFCLIPAVGKRFSVKADSLVSCDEFIHMYVCAFRSGEKKKRFIFSKRIFPTLPWDKP